ncbi:poly-gamma-glutamate hydrolase family protein [Streptomyces cellostaticus]|uniref:poly-gamma-glutamate hydrolase family protein n=1 Tax=Streptomyces cellostaticus TaxID=67285 RepID=UPI00131C5E91|nr:poly-gamma-glutamate hydrolase family protein [Streptomyces cellostaticus]
MTESVVIEGVEFAASLTIGSAIGLLALHGTREGGTAELVHEVAAGTGATALVFIQPAGDRVHIPSHRMCVPICDPLRQFLSHVSLTISLHGHLRHEHPRSIFLGGTNRTAAATLAHSLTLLAPAFETIDDLAHIPRGLRGLHPDNAVNLSPFRGVQIELPVSARTGGPRTSPEVLDAPQPTVTTALIDGVRRLT